VHLLRKTKLHMVGSCKSYVCLMDLDTWSYG